MITKRDVEVLREVAHDYDELGDDEAHERLSRIADEIEKMKTTADGVVVTPEMELWAHHPTTGEVCGVVAYMDANNPEMHMRERLDLCYSSRAAAEAAAKGGGE